MSDKIIRADETRDLVASRFGGRRPGRSTIDHWIKIYGFPRPVKLSPKFRGFFEAQVLAWLDERLTGAVTTSINHPES